MGWSPQSWLTTPVVGKKWIIGAGLFWSALCLALLHSNYALDIDSKLCRPLDFLLRDSLGQSVKVDERLKIYSIDDKTFEKLDSWVLNVEQWALLIKHLADHNPRAIVIDGMFTKLSDPYMKLDEAVATLSDVKVPIIVGSYVTPQTIKYRDGLEMSKKFHNIGDWYANGTFDEHSLPSMRDMRKFNVYGPTKTIQAVFDRIGHISYTGNAVVSGLIRVGDDKVLPHMGLLVADELLVENRMIKVNGSTMPVTSDGDVILNFMSPRTFFENNYSLYGLLVRASKGMRTPRINEGDVVYIMPHMYTGNTDFKSSPYGRIPGGIIPGVVMNSVLKGNWLKPLGGGEMLILLAVAAATIIALQLSVTWFWTSLVLGVGVILSFSTYLFSYHGIVVPWFYPILGWLGVGITLFAEKMRISEKKAHSIRLAFEGAVPDEELKKILKNKDTINLEARERVVSIVFIDVVGFSLLAENMLPRTAFESLKQTLGHIGETIHEYGGIVDKTLGDGLLAYFGYRFDDDMTTSDHAELALRCAIKIQEENLARNLEAATQGEFVYPLRIGINTASCYIGDLGAGDVIDFTVVGNGVNFAKRLEGACDMHSVLMGGNTYDLVRGIGMPGAAVTKRFIRIKHHSELVEAYEYDPFYQDADLRKGALEAFRKCANIERIDQRWPVRDPSKIQLTSDFGPGELVNFSHKGLSVKFSQLLVKGTTVNLSLDAAGGILKSLLVKDGVRALHGEVRWGYDDGSGYVHGIMIQNLSEQQSERMVEYLCEFAFSREHKKDGEIVGAS